MKPTGPVVLVPVGSAIDPACDDALRELERRGYTVRRVRGYSAIDSARNQMATDALADGFDELVWIDSDVVFRPDDVDALRANGRPLACALYPKKGPREFACNFLPGTAAVTFGKAGGLVPIQYCGFGFVYTRRDVYDRVQNRFQLPVLNRRFGKPLVPYFAPFWVGEGDDAHYLAEDYAFCERARQAGFELVADTRIRLWHVGSYRYSWEDAGSDKQRFGTYTFHINGEAKPADPSPPVAPLSDPGPLR